MSKCGECGGNNFHVAYCGVPIRDGQWAKSQAELAQLRAHLSEAEAKVRERDELLEAAESFIRSLNSIAFEEWYGRYQDGEFVIFDADGNGIASGKDALAAYAVLTQPKAEVIVPFKVLGDCGSIEGLTAIATEVTDADK